MLRVENIALSFGGVIAIDNVSFDVAEGEITSLIGPNGAGKTSLFNVISGFYRPQHGRVFFDGRDITHEPSHKRATLGIARTFQNIALFAGMNVLENIKLGAHVQLKANPFTAGWYIGAAQREELALRERIEREVIDFLEIDHIRKAPIAALPFGLQKRVELGRALALRPKILLLDEPVSGMNREETEDMARFILDIQEEWGTTILLVEHDMGMVMDISDKVIVVNFGEKIAEGSPAEVQSNPAVIEAYLGTAEAAE